LTRTAVISPASTGETLLLDVNVILDVILERQAGADVDRLLSVFGVAAVTHAVVRRALVLAWPDFEDAVCAAAAEASGCEAIVTRDPDGYPHAPLPVIDPAAALSWLLAQ